MKKVHHHKNLSNLELFYLDLASKEYCKLEEEVLQLRMENACLKSAYNKLNEKLIIEQEKYLKTIEKYCPQKIDASKH